MTVQRDHTYTEPGVYEITATDGVNTAHAMVTVRDENSPQLSVDPTSVPAGEDLTVTGINFTAAVTGTVELWSGTTGGTKLAEAEVTVGDDRTIPATALTVPTDAAAGDARVVAVIGSDDAAPVPVTITAQRLAAPTGVQADPADATTIAVSWTAVNGADQYVVEHKATADGDDAWQAAPAVTEPTANVGELTTGTSYDFRVQAQDSTGTRGDSVYSTVVSATPEGGGAQLPAPTDVTATPTDATTIAVTWGAVDGADQYVVEYKATADGDDAWQAAPAVTGGETTANVGELTTGTSYDFRVQAQDSTGTRPSSHWSAPVTGTVG